MTEDSSSGAVAAAERVCAALRELAYAVVPRGLAGPADVYEVLGALSEVAGVYGAVAERLAGVLDSELQADRIGVDLPMSEPARLPDPLAEVARATAALGEARGYAERLSAALDTAHETTARLHRRG